MEINNIPKMPVKISADSHHGVVLRASAFAAFPAACVLRLRLAVFLGLSQ
jgi:hypothetical protein